MNVILDACSIINLHNGGVLRCVCCIPHFHVQVGPIVGGECSEDCALAIASLHTDGDLEYLEDNEIEVDDFLSFVDQNRLGDGESECILLANLDSHRAADHIAAGQIFCRRGIAFHKSLAYRVR